MPGAQERVLRRRINSVQKTKKITRAMELIAASRVVQAQARANAARPYARKLTGVIEDLAAGGASIDHPLLREADEITKVALVVMVSDRGLAGAYNGSVLRAAEQELANIADRGAEYELVLVGRKAAGYFSYRNYRIHADYEGISDKPTYENAREIAGVVTDLFSNQGVDRVVLIYTEFISIGSQKVVVRNFLPLQSTEAMASEGESEALASFEFEPSPDGVLEALLPRYVESRIYAALLDAAASEHANRQRAMKAATDNAEDMIVRLSRELNRARQEAITTEIMEIIGGAEGLSDDGDDATSTYDPDRIHRDEESAA